MVCVRRSVVANRKFMREERQDIRASLERLTPDQWAARSLCPGWSVQDLAAHLLGWDDLLIYRSKREHLLALGRFLVLYLSCLGRMSVVNGRIGAGTGHLTPSEILGRFGANDGPDLKWLFDQSNPGAHLAEYVIHHRDLSRPLGLSHDIPNDRLVAALNGVTQLPGVRLGAWWRLGRHRWQATDVAWGRGRGPVVSATGEAILLTLAGRHVLEVG
jgi:hypothetical protein